MRKILISGLVLVLAAAAGQFALAGKSDKETQMSGEVVDICCYLNPGMSDKKPSEIGCARKCIESGKPVGLLSGKTLYLVLGADGSMVNAQLAPHAGQPVTLSGQTAERNGMKVFLMASFMPTETRSNMGFRTEETQKK